MNNPNYIHGRPLQFGDWQQIRYIRWLQRIFSGEAGFEPDYFDFRNTNDEHLDSGDRRDANQIWAYFDCPVHWCGWQNCFKKHYDPHCYYQTMLEAWPNVECRNCGTEYRMDTGSDRIYVVQKEMLIS